jgi:hypothetical protein
MPKDIDRDYCNRILPHFKRALQHDEALTPTDSMSMRIDVKRFINRKMDFFLRKERGAGGGAIIYLMIDCSGSMRGPPLKYAKHFLYVLNALHRQGFIDLRVVLTHECYTIVPTPIPDDIIECLEANGGHEGIARSLKKTERLLKDADLCFIFTDAQITDGSADPSVWNRFGLKAIGVYAGTKKAVATTLLKEFDYALYADDFEQLCPILLRLIKKYKKG